MNNLSINPDDFERLIEYYWSCWIGLHWGFRRNAVAFWACSGMISEEKAWNFLGIASDRPLDVVIVYRELVEQLLPEFDLAQKIIGLTPIPERKNLRRIYAGKNVFETGESSAKPIAKIFNPLLETAKMPRLSLTDDSIESRIASFRMIYEGMRRSNRLRDPMPERDTDEFEAWHDARYRELQINSPLLLISEDCPQLIRTIPSLGYDPKNPEDVQRVETIQDDIWQATMNTFVNCHRIVNTEPMAVKRFRAISASSDPLERRMNMIRFDATNKRTRRSKRL